MKQFLLGNSDKAMKQSYLWVALGGLLNAGQSALLLMVISRTNKPEDCAVYSIGYAIACLALALGNFGIRNFQVTDVDQKYPFETYLSARIITDIGLLLLVAGYVVRGRLVLGYSFEKCLAIVLLGLLKLIDSIEDVFHGMYQKKQRLDIAARCQTTRYVLVLSTFSISLMISHHLIISSSIAILFSLTYFLYTLHATFGTFDVSCHINLRDKRILHLLGDCISLFAGGFLAIYIANVPKYVIDEICSWEKQACFNYIFMPVYVVSVLNTFIYQPILAKMAEKYKQNEKLAFLKLFILPILVILVLMCVILMGGGILGIPILSILYNTDLNGYKYSFMILLVGSGFLAIQEYLAAIITVMRRQRWLLIGYAVSALTAFLVSRPVIQKYDVIGASVLYSGIMMMQMTIFMVLFIIFYYKGNKA